MMFPNNLTADGIPKADALQLMNYRILMSYTDGILPVFGTVIFESGTLRNW